MGLQVIGSTIDTSLIVAGTIHAIAFGAFWLLLR